MNDKISAVKNAPPERNVIYLKRLNASPPSDNSLKKYNIIKTPSFVPKH
jgi:hypothetical protein